MCISWLSDMGLHAGISENSDSHQVLRCMVHKTLWTNVFSLQCEGSLGYSTPNQPQHLSHATLWTILGPFCLDSPLHFITWRGKVDDGSGSLPPSPRRHLGKEALYLSDVLVYTSSFHFLSLVLGRQGTLRAHANLFSQPSLLVPQIRKGFLFIFTFDFLFQCKIWP